LYHCYAITHKTLILNEMKKDQFTHNLEKARRQAKVERETRDAINKYHQEFDSWLVKLQLNHLTK